MKNEAPEKLDQYIKTKDDKAKLEHFYKNKSMINVVIRIAETSCRVCKAMILRRIRQGLKIEPESFCKYCVKKHESSLDKIKESMEE